MISPNDEIENDWCEVLVPLKPWGLSVKVMIKDDLDRCLLLRRSMSSKGNPGKWEPPGGKINEGENFGAALLREVLEETNFTISIQHVAGVLESELPKVKVIHLILEGQVDSGKLRLSEEHDAYIWVHYSQLSSMELADWFLPFAKTYSQKIHQRPPESFSRRKSIIHE